MNPICVDCLVPMTCTRNGVAVELNGCSLYSADLYVCPECGGRVITGMSDEPMVSDYEDHYSLSLANAEKAARLYRVEEK